MHCLLDAAFAEMILVAAFAFALLWGMLRGASLRRLQFLNLRLYGLVLIAFTLQAILIFLPVWNSYGSSARLGAMLISYAMLGGFVWANRQLPGVWLLGLGLLANGLVIFANGGFMPVTFEALRAAGMSRLVTGSAPGTIVMGSKDVLLPYEATRLSFLSDIFVLPPPFPITGVFSVGDILIAVGIFFLVTFALGTNRNAVLPNFSGDARKG